jgi:PAS domain S-box-containing protein
LQEGGTALYHDPFLHEPVTAAIVPLREINGTVIIAQPKQYTFAANRILVARMAMVAAACLLVAMGIGSLFGYRVVRPILRLTRDVQTMRRTKSNALRPLRVCGRDEIDTLTASFHAMRQEVLDTSRALLSANDYMENIIGSMREALLVLAPTGTIQMANPAICALLGYKDIDLLGHQFTIILPSHFVPEHAWFDSLMEDGALSGVETVLTTKGGGRVPVVFSASVMRNHQGEIQGIVCVAQDITERKQAEEALRQSKEAAEEGSRAKSTFLATMSHELRTPLSSIIGFANLLLRNAAKTLRPQDILYLERIRANGIHLLNLINDILDLSKVEAGHMQLDIAPTALAELIQEVVEQLADTVRHPAVQVRLDIPQSLTPLATDAGRLKQILLNLVGNALKFTPQGTVTIQVESDPVTQQPTCINVIDTGIGIPAERLESIFERFQQADNSIARKYGGTGLGLAISRALCQLLGYQLTVESTVGQGSTFRIILAV